MNEQRSRSPEQLREELLHAARQVRNNAYVPYSGFKVGVAIRLAGNGELVSGCNVENVSYGATVCAERNAVFTALGRYGVNAVKGQIEELLLVTDADPPAVPCALCLQVLQEFAGPRLPIHIADLTGIRRTTTLGEMLPQPFSSFER